jgi:hypothetical protein
MTLQWRWGRMLRLVGLVALALVAGLAGFVQIQQHILRWRAERLLADMRELQSHKGTWADAQKIMTRWGAWGSFEGSCTAKQCEYYVIIIDSLSEYIGEHAVRYPIFTLPSWLGRALDERGGLVEVTLSIKNSVVTESSFQLDLGELIATANAVNEFDPYVARSQRLLHPEYWIGKNGGCTGCTKFETGYTPLAGRDKIRELTDFNLSCITRWSPCTMEEDVLPTAWKQYQEELASDKNRMDAFDYCSVPLEFYGSQDYSIAVVEVLSRKGPLASGGNRDWSAGLRIVRTMKGEIPWPQNKPLTASEAGQEEEIHGWGFTDMIAGKRYIIFGSFEEDQIGKKALVLDNCGVVPYNEQNLAAIQRGIDASLARHLPDR